MNTAAEPLVVTISHRLGREEAKRRIETGFGRIRAEIAPYINSLDCDWHDYRLDFRAAAMMQTITGNLEVNEDNIRIELGLPWLLHFAAKTIAGRIERQGAALLEGPKS